MSINRRLEALEALAPLPTEQRITTIQLVDGITGEVGAEIPVSYPMDGGDVARVIEEKHRIQAQGGRPTVRTK